MSEDLKEPEVQTPPDATPVETKTEVQDDKVSLSLVERMIERFSPKPKEEAKAEEQPTKTVEELVQEGIKEALGDIVPKLKSARDKELTEREKGIEEAKELEQVATQYQDFVKFKATQENLSITEYLEKNTQFKAKQKVVGATAGTHQTNNTELSDRESKIYDNMKKSGRF